MNEQTAAHLTHTMKSWINPAHPGRHKSLALALLMGFMLGPIGVALYFRSLAQGGLALMIAVILALITGWSPEWLGATVGAAWAVGRVLFDNQPPAGPKAATPAPMSPADGEPTSPAAAMA